MGNVVNRVRNITVTYDCAPSVPRVNVSRWIHHPPIAISDLFFAPFMTLVFAV
jgi:hypothetical protein